MIVCETDLSIMLDIYLHVISTFARSRIFVFGLAFQTLVKSLRSKNPVFSERPNIHFSSDKVLKEVQALASILDSGPVIILYFKMSHMDDSFFDLKFTKSGPFPISKLLCVGKLITSHCFRNNENFKQTAGVL
jgi:hypothetical protein